jgi:hypothetical protein
MLIINTSTRNPHTSLFEISDNGEKLEAKAQQNSCFWSEEDYDNNI